MTAPSALDQIPVPPASPVAPAAPSQIPVARRPNKKQWVPSNLPRRNWVCINRPAVQTGFVAVNFTGAAKPQVRPHLDSPDPFSDMILLDPALEVDQSLLTGLAEGERRYNLEIVSELGDIDIDVWLAPSNEQKPKRTTILLEGADVSMRLHSLGDQPVDITIAGTVISLSLPRGFCGRLKSDTSRQDVTITRSLSKAIPFAVYQDARDHLVATFGAEKPDANGSTINLRSSSSQIHFDLAKYKKGFFESLFGRS